MERRARQQPGRGRSMTVMVRLENREPLRRGGTAFSPQIVAGLMVLVDSVAVALPGLFFYVTYVGWSGDTYGFYTAGLALQMLMTTALFSLAGLHKFEAITRTGRHSGRIISLSAGIFALLVILAFGLKISDQFSRVWVFASLICTPPSLCLLRASCGGLLRRAARRGALTRNIAIIGVGEQARRLLERIARADEPWNRVVGVFDDRRGRVATSVYGMPVLGRVDDLMALARRQRVDEVVIALPWNAETRLNQIVHKLRELPVNIRLASDLAGFTYRSNSLNSLSGVPMLDVAQRPNAGWPQLLKFALDKLFAGLLLVVLAPLMVAIAAAIRLESRGPALFRQRRYGFNNRAFTMLKFRTMVDCRDASLVQACRGDPRVTRVGRFLRRTSLDELPQLFNVLSGSMSLVGPRPHAVAHNKAFAEIIDGYYARHRVRPGITGWAQVNGHRGETDTPGKMRARVAYDIYYIEQWSLLLDLQILLRTAVCGFVHENAY